MYEVSFRSDLWLWDARQSDSWTFATVPADISEEIREITAGSPRGFGSVRVEARIGATTWRTSVFPDTGSGGFVLPIKAAVRRAESIQAGDQVALVLRLLDT